MKRCPECRRDYYDDTLLYCLDDGNALLEGPATGSVSEPGAIATGFQSDEPQTAILHSTAAPNDVGQNCPTIADKLKNYPPIKQVMGETAGPSENTTITLVVTNQKLPFAALQRHATQVHSSMARAIQPFATDRDGDILYAVTTDEVENPGLSASDLNVIASEVAWDAVLASVPLLPERPKLLASRPSAASLHRFDGIYEFYGGGRLVVSAQADSLSAKFEGNGRIYFDKDKNYPIAPAENRLFIIESPGRETLRFNESGEQISGLTLNLGPWAMNALRKP